MEDILISRNDLMKRWHCNAQALYKKEHEGVLHRCPHVPGTMYRMEEVRQCEGIGNVDPLSPFERKKLEAEIAKKDKEIRALKEKIQNAVSVLFVREAGA